MNFYKLIAVITIILLIISLAFIGVAMYNSSNKVLFPPNIGNCPDFYKPTDSTNIYKCTRMYNSNNQSDTCKEFDGTDENYKNPGMGPSSGLCEKKKWAQGCNVSWDGITNNSAVCYQTNT